MDEQNKANGKPGFWSTLPGILTGIAAVVTAIGSLTAGLYQTGIIGHKADAMPKSEYVKPAPTSPSPAQQGGQPAQQSSQSGVHGAGPDATASIIRHDGSKVVVSLASLIYFTGHDFSLDDGHRVDFSKVHSADIIEIIGMRAKLRLTLVDGTVVVGFVQASDFQGDDKIGRVVINIDKVMRVEIN